MIYIYIFLAIVIFLLMLTYIFDEKINKDHFYISDPNLPFDSPWYNPIRSTRNMSYDLRGDVTIPNTGFWSPFNMSTLIPIQNKPLWMVS
ncbi:hypothetical protein Indivirus_6_4 [Indivirus ILV1]|uniref:Uncharacterized protein n=1 Tax=Indivirus ILV1 TaxID=1977633 RepID=A0A1V0SE70_9VIRU|nr:hypothetical protein Indivirus_6_4 [Indivirus ILV1]